MLAMTLLLLRSSAAPGIHGSTTPIRPSITTRAQSKESTRHRRNRAGVDAPFSSPHELVRPWRRATLVASLVAAIELVLLVVAAAALIAKPLSHAIRHHAEAVALAPAEHAKAAAPKLVQAPPVVGKARPRARVKIMVLNGNGLAGAAAGAASKLHSLGYVVSGTGNAKRQDYATSVVMYRPGFRAEGLRLARDLKVKVVGPLDGIHLRDLKGGQLAVVLGA